MSEGAQRDWTRVDRGAVERSVDILKQNGYYGLAPEVANLLAQYDLLCVGINSIVNQAKATLPPPTVHELEDILSNG